MNPHRPTEADDFHRNARLLPTQCIGTYPGSDRIVHTCPPCIRRTGRHTCIPPARHRYHRHALTHHTGQRTGHSPMQGTILYSEKQVRNSEVHITSSLLYTP